MLKFKKIIQIFNKKIFYYSYKYKNNYQTFFKIIIILIFNFNIE